MPAKKPLDYLSPLEPRTRGVATLDALQEMIERAGIQLGDKLPPEVLMATTLGVGRSTIREALKSWEGLGIIRRRRGDGTYLIAPVPSSKSPVPTVVRLEGEALIRLQDVRRTLESDVVQRAAANATEKQRRRIVELGERLLQCVRDGEPWREADWAFHEAIYEASGNPIYGKMLHYLDGALTRSESSPFGRDDFGLDSFPEHRKLALAIARGDEKGARRSINIILDIVIAEISRLIGAPGRKGKRPTAPPTARPRNSVANGRQR